MNADYNKAVRSLEKFLADDSHMTKDELRIDLSDEGVNVDAFLVRFETIIRNGYQHQLRKASEFERALVRKGGKSIFGDLAAKSWDELQRIFEEIRSGAFGNDLKQAALARCRNQMGGKISEEELRSWLEDISSGIGEK